MILSFGLVSMGFLDDPSVINNGLLLCPEVDLLPIDYDFVATHGS